MVYHLILNPACISNYMLKKVLDEITYPFPNFNGCTVEVWERINNFIPHIMMDVITYPCWYYMFIFIDKLSPCWPWHNGSHTVYLGPIVAQHRVIGMSKPLHLYLISYWNEITSLLNRRIVFSCHLRKRWRLTQYSATSKASFAKKCYLGLRRRHGS